MMRVLIEAGADVNARSTIIAWERQRTAEPRDKWLPPGGLTPLLFAAREGMRRLRQGAARRGRRHQRRRSGPAHGAGPGADQRPLRRRGRADRARRRRRTCRTRSAGRRCWAAVDAHTMPSSNRPAPRETDDTLTQPGHHHEAARQGRAGRRRAARADSLPHEARSRRRRRARRRHDAAAARGQGRRRAGRQAAAREGRQRRGRRRRNGVNAIMMAANVAAREEDMTGRNKTQKEAIETITPAARGRHRHQRRRHAGPHGRARRRAVGPDRRRPVPARERREARRQGQARLHALDTALGLAGGFGFDGKAGVVHEDTAKAIRETGWRARHSRGRPAASRRGGRSAGRRQELSRKLKV